jgi:3-phenylpropionate/cinnamic acid dioxygenase small subunit
MSVELVDRDKIRDVLTKYCTYGDNGRFRDLAGLFTEDGKWEGRMGSASGRTEIEALMTRTNPPPGQGPVRRHLVTNISVTIDGKTANVQSTFMMVRESENGPMIGAVGSYNDILTNRGGDWLIVARKVTPEIIGEARLKS